MFKEKKYVESSAHMVGFFKCKMWYFVEVIRKQHTFKLWESEVYSRNPKKEIKPQDKN